MAAETAVLVSTYLDDKTPTNLCISTLIESVTERQSLQGSGCSKEWISKLNTLLNSNKDRWLGITLLATTLQQCETEVFTSNCISWMKVMQHVLESSSSPTSLVQSSVQLLDDIMRYAVQFPDLMRNLANSTIPSIITALLSWKDKDIVYCVRGICSCLRYFPGPSSQFKAQIEKCLMSCVDINSDMIRKCCAQCFALLAASNSSTHSDKQRKNWEVQWNRVLKSIHSTLDLLHGYHRIQSTSETVANELLPLKAIKTDEPCKTNTCIARLRSLLKYLNSMIREGTRKVTTFPLDDTMVTIERLLSVNENMLKGIISVDVVLLKTCLALIHADTVDVLCSLIQRCGSILLPHANTIAKLLVKELSWTSGTQSMCTQSDSMRSYSNLRCTVYKCFPQWRLLNASFQQDVMKDVISYILKEIRVVTASKTKLISLVTDQYQQKGSSKKSKKRKLQEIEQLSTNQEKVDPSCNAKVCHAALAALSSIIMNFGECMNKDTFKEIQVSLVHLVSQFQTFSMPQPYSDADCRMEVYHCLLACIVGLPSGAHNAISCVIKFLEEGVQDTHFMVSNYCKEALTIATALIHPLVPSIEAASPAFVIANKISQETMDSNHNVQANGKTLNLGTRAPVSSDFQEKNACLINSDRTATIVTIGIDQNQQINRENESSVERSPIVTNSRFESTNPIIEMSQCKKMQNPFMPKIHTSEVQSKGQGISQSISSQLSENESRTLQKRPLSVGDVAPLETQRLNVENSSPNTQSSQLNINVNNGKSNKTVTPNKSFIEQPQDLGTERQDDNTRQDSYHNSGLQGRVSNNYSQRDESLTASGKVDSCEGDVSSNPNKKLETDGLVGDADETVQGMEVEVDWEKASCSSAQPDTQEADDVDDMLASFVDSSPDSDTDQ